MSGFRKYYGSYGRHGALESSEIGGDNSSTAGKYTSTASATQPDKSYIPRLCSSRDPYMAYKSKKEELDKKSKTESYLVKKKSAADSYLDTKKSTVDSYLDTKKSTVDGYLDKNKSTAVGYLDKKASVLNYPEKKPASSSYEEKQSTNLHNYADKKPVTATYLGKKTSALSYIEKKTIADNYVEKKPATKSYIDKKPSLDSYMEKKAALDFNRLKVPVTKSSKSRETSPINSLKFSINSPGSNKYNACSPSFPERKSPFMLNPTNIRSRSKSPHEKDIPKKTDSSAGYSPSYASYKMYTRTNSFARPIKVNEIVPEKTSSRFGYKNKIPNAYNNPRLNENISPVCSLEHVSYNNDKGEVKLKEKSEYSTSSKEEMSEQSKDFLESKAPDKDDDEELSSDGDENAHRTYLVVTRHTSPTPPGSSLYVRTRRADMAKTEEATITRLKKKPFMSNKNVQTDDSRSCRFSIVRSAPARTYVDANLSSNYLGYAGRFSTQYSSGREKTSSSSTIEKSPSITSTNSKSNSPENSEQDAQKNTEYMDTVSYCIRRPIDKGTNNSHLSIEKENSSSKSSELENNTNWQSTEKDNSVESISVNQETDGESSSDIVINVNLTLNKRVSPLVSPSEKPPSHGSKKTDSSKIKAKSKSGEKKKGPRKTKRQNMNDSTESCSLISLTTSSSDDEYGSKSKRSSKSSSSSDDTSSRTSADEVSISLDKPSATRSIPDPEEPRTKEAKTFLIKALAPITNLFKSLSADSGDKSISSECTSKDVVNVTLETENASEGKTSSSVTTNKSSSNLNREMFVSHESNSEISNGLNQSNKPSPLTTESLNKNVKKITRIESGERKRWIDFSNKDKSTSKSSLEKSASSSSSTGIQFRIPNRDCDEKPWWLDSCANIPEGIEILTPVREESSSLCSEKSDRLELNKLRHIDSGEKEWWQNSCENISKDRDSYSSKEKQCSKNESKTNTETKSSLRLKPLQICHVQSGEKAWWLSSNQNVPEGIEKLPPPPPGDSDSSSSESEEFEVYRPTASPFPPQMDDNNLPLGDRIGPEGLETPHRPVRGSGEFMIGILGDIIPPYNEPTYHSHHLRKARRDPLQDVFISHHTDIDDVLGPGHVYHPLVGTILKRGITRGLSFSDCEEIDATEVKIHDSTPQRPVIRKLINWSELSDCSNEDLLDDVSLQIVKDGDYGPYLDLDSSLTEQQEEFEGMQDSRKNAIVLRTQLSVRVHSIIERLLHTQGRELRRALFSLKQILKADKDLVHEFVANNGLNCLIQVGTAAEHDFLNHILRALGQILLYVDGMHGVMEHKTCVQWLYSLIGNQYRHVVKTALKLLLIFVEYTEQNSLLLIQAVHAADIAAGQQPWYNIMKLLKDFNAPDTELFIYAMTLINKSLNGIPDQDTYYDQTDALEEQGIDEIIQLYMSKQGTDLDLLRQFQIYEAVLSHEDGDSTGIAIKQLDETIIKAIRHRNNFMSKKSERRKSKRQNNATDNNKGNSQMYTTGLQQRIQNGTLGHTVSSKDIASLGMRNQKQLENGGSPTENKEADDRNVLLNRENTVKDLTQRLSNQNNVQNSPEDKISRVSDMTGLILKAKEGLAKSQSKDIVKSPTVEIVPKVVEIKASENELHWEELRKSLNRNLRLCDLDFTDLRVDDDDDLTTSSIFENGIPPPPPPIGFFNHTGVVPPPPPRNSVPLPPPSLNISLNLINTSSSYNDSNESDTSTIKKNKKTVKLFWKEVKDRPAPEPLLNKVGGLIWEDLPEVTIDTKMLEHLFESRTNDLLIKEKLTEPKNNMILDAKRSNAINIGMKKLPTPRSIKTAILKMDTTVITREGIEKLLNMQPTEEERVKIQEAQYANPDLPLGSAEQFLLALASITELASRLKLWAFKLDFEYCEKEIAEPLMDLKQGIELLKANKTFKTILSTLRSVGSFLNGTTVKGFRLEYLSKVMEVKDTVHKHPLLHHICQIIMDKFPDTSDFFSEVGPVIRASKVDFEEIGHNLVRLETECKASWDHLKRVAKHDGQIIMKTKINEFLTDAAERIILLGIIRKRVMNRYNQFLLHIGVPLTDIPKTKPSEFLKIVSEFALEYRTSRERVLQQLEKKANHRERNKTRGKMIIDIEKYGGVAEVTADATLKQLIMTNGDDGYSLSRKKSTTDKTLNGDLNAEDEIFESLVKSTMSKRKPMIPRDRKRARIADRKSLKRSRTRESVPQLDSGSTAS